MKRSILDKLSFIVPRMEKRSDCFPGVVEIIPVLVIGSIKGQWRCELTGADAGVRRSFNKNNFILYDSLLGARAHLKSCVLREVARLEKEIDVWFDAAERVGIEDPTK